MTRGKKAAVLGAIVVVAWAATANAHLCILKTGSYDLADPYVCDGGDGTKTINLDCSPLDSEIELDVVFQQDPILKKRLDAYQSKIKYDPSMGDPAYCNCHDRRSSKETPPSGDLCDHSNKRVCIDYPVIWNDISSSLKLDLLDNFITVGEGDYYVRIAMGTLERSAPPSNLLMQSLVFKNIYSSEQENAFAFSFEPWTEMFDPEYCELLSKPCGVSTQHRAMKSRINIIRHGCFNKAPVFQGAVCELLACEEGAVCEAEVKIKFGLPYNLTSADSISTYHHDNYRVKIMPTYQGGGQEATEAVSPYVTKVAARDVVSFDLIGASSSLLDSYPVPTGPINCRKDFEPPKKDKWHPEKGSIVSTLSPVIMFETDEDAWCRWSLEDAGYDDMSEECLKVDGIGNWHRCEAKSVDSDQPGAYVSCRDRNGNKNVAAERVDYKIDYCSLRPEECDIEIKLSAPFASYTIETCGAAIPGCLVPYGQSIGYYKKQKSSISDIVVEVYEEGVSATGPSHRTWPSGQIPLMKLRRGTCEGCLDSAKKYGVRARIPNMGIDEGVKRLLGCEEGFLPNECVLTMIKPAFISGSGEIVLQPVELPDFSSGAGGGDIGNPTCRSEVHVANLQPLKHRLGAVVGDELYHPAADFNLDGRIDISDLMVLKKNFGKPVAVSGGTKLCDPLFDARNK